MGFEYKGRSDESIKREAEAASGNYDDYMKPGLTKFKPRDGENQIRVLPGNSSWDNKVWGDHWGLELWLHQNIGVDKSTYLCASKMKGEPCAICDARQEVLDDKEEADALRPGKRVGVLLVDRNAERDGPQFWSMPHQSVAKEIATRSTDRKSGAGVLIDDPDKGYDVFFRKSGSGRNTDYTGVEIDRDPSYLVENAKRQDEFLDYMMDHPLPDYLNFYSYEYLEKVVKGQTSRRESDKDDRGEDRRTGRGGRDEKDGGRGGRGGGRDEAEDRGGRGGRDRGRDDPKEERGASRDRGRDDRGGGDKEDRSTGRDAGRGRDESRDRGRDDPKEDRGRGRDEDRGGDRDRGRDKPEEDRGGSRGGRDEKDGDSRSGGRDRDSGRDDPKDEGRGRDREDRGSSRGRDDPKDDPKEDRGSSRRSSRDDPKDDPKEDRGSRRASRDEPKDDKGKDDKDSGRETRRSSRDADETGQAKEAIGDMKERRSRR